MARFGSRVAGLVYSGRVMRFFGESLRQAGILILGSALVIWAFVFILGLQCGLQGAYFFRSQGVPAYAGLFAAWCDLREALPYAFGYILSAKVGMRYCQPRSARCASPTRSMRCRSWASGRWPTSWRTRLLGALVALPFIYLFGSCWRAGAATSSMSSIWQRRVARCSLGELLDVPGAVRPDRRHGQGSSCSRSPPCSSAATTATRPRAARSGSG